MARKSNRKPSAKNKGRRPLRFRLTLLLLVLLIILGGAFVVSAHTFFPLENVVYSGNKYLSPEEANVILGAKKGDSLLSLSSEELADRLMESPWVRQVSIRKELAGTLLVDLVEAEPVAVLKEGDGHYIVDKQGIKLSGVDESDYYFLPLVNVKTENREVYTEALQLAREVRSKGFEKSIIEITGRKAPESIEMMVDGLTVKMGNGDYSVKLERLLGLESEIAKISKNQDVEFVDLRFANRMYVKPVAEVLK